MAAGRPLSYWEGNFSGAMLNFGRVSTGHLEEAGNLNFKLPSLSNIHPTNKNCWNHTHTHTPKKTLPTNPQSNKSPPKTSKTPAFSKCFAILKKNRKTQPNPTPTNPNQPINQPLPSIHGTWIQIQRRRQGLSRCFHHLFLRGAVQIHLEGSCVLTVEGKGSVWWWWVGWLKNGSFQKHVGCRSS